MGWNNQIFNVNGRGLEMLTKAIELACCRGSSESNFYGNMIDHGSEKIIGSLYDPKCGLIWLWAEADGSVKYPAPLTARQAAEISFAWLKTDDAKKMECNGWDANADHDGNNTLGWRVYCEDWG